MILFLNAIYGCLFEISIFYSFMFMMLEINKKSRIKKAKQVVERLERVLFN